MCFNANIRVATSAGVAFRLRVALCGRRQRKASYTVSIIEKSSA